MKALLIAAFALALQACAVPQALPEATALDAGAGDPGGVRTSLLQRLR